MAYGITVVKTTATSVTVYVTGISQSYTKNDRYAEFTCNGTTYKKTASIPAGDGSNKTNLTSSTITLTDTSWVPGRSYRLYARIYYSGGVTSDFSTFIDIPESGGSGGGSGDSGDDEEKDEITVDPWDWNDYPDDFEALDEKQATTNFSYETWNALVNKVYKMREAYDDRYGTNYGSWDFGEGLSRSKTKMSSSDKVLTATRYNSLKNNVGAHPKWGGTGIPDVKGESTGDGDNPTIVSAQEHFIELVEVINDIIYDYLS